MKQIFLVLSCAVTFHSFAQTPNIEWQKCFGGSDGEETYQMKATKDGGYILAGYSKSNDGDVVRNHGLEDFWIVKLNNTGNIEWQKDFGGSKSDIAYSIQQTTDKGYIVAGCSSSNDGDVSGNHGNKDFWIIKLSSNGNIQWQKMLGGSNDDVAFSVKQTSNGDYVVAGYSSSNDGDVNGNHHGEDYWIVQLNSVGNLVRQKCLGGYNNERAVSIDPTDDGGYIIGGSSLSNNGDVSGHHGNGRYNYDIWIVKVNGNFDINWQKSLGGSYDESNGIVQQTFDGGYIVAGCTSSTDGDVTENHGNVYTYDYWIIKLNNNGEIQWQKCFGGSQDEISQSIQQSLDNGYIITGYSASNDGNVTGHHGGTYYIDYWILKLNEYGDMQWQKSLGGFNDDVATSIEPTSDGGYFISGYTYSNNDGDISGNHGNSDYWVVKLASDLLPLVLKNFTATLHNDIVHLTWQTITEINTRYFELQRSSDGIHFSPIAKIDAFNSMSIETYSYNDDIKSIVNTSKLYYRLNEVNKDGISNLSNIVHVIMNRIGLFNVFPNPVHTQLNVEGKNLQQAEIYDLSGKLLITQKAINQNFILIKVNRLVAGVYKIKIKDLENKTETKTVLIE